MHVTSWVMMGLGIVILAAIVASRFLTVAKGPRCDIGFCEFEQFRAMGGVLSHEQYHELCVKHGLLTRESDYYASHYGYVPSEIEKELSLVAKQLRASMIQ